MAVYTIVNGTVLRRRRDAAERAELADEQRKSRKPRGRPDLAAQVTTEFRSQRGTWRRTGSTR